MCVPWVRWATYAVSCSILAFEIATFQKFQKYVRLVFVFFIAGTLLTGLFAILSVISETNRYIWYGIGFALYVPALLLMYLLSDPCGKFRLKRKRWSVWTIPIFVTITWTIYPIAFILGPNLLNVISTTVESWIYLGADLLTKVFFGFWMPYLEARY